jgi:hypothetical protein
VHKNVTNLRVKIICELESRVKNYHGKTKKQKDGSHACIRLEGDRGGMWHVAGWLVGGRRRWARGWLVGWRETENKSS